jgi:hypothetical protein
VLAAVAMLMLLMPSNANCASSVPASFDYGFQLLYSFHFVQA